MDHKRWFLHHCAAGSADTARVPSVRLRSRNTASRNDAQFAHQPGNRLRCVVACAGITHLAIPACFGHGNRIVRLGGINPDENLVSMARPLCIEAHPDHPGNRAQSAPRRRATSTAQRTGGLTVSCPGKEYHLVPSWAGEPFMSSSLTSFCPAALSSSWLLSVWSVFGSPFAALKRACTRSR